MRMVEERGKGGLYTPRSLIRKLKVYTRIDKKRNYKTRRRFFCEATTPRAGEIFLPVNKLIFSTQAILSGIEALGRPRNTNIRRGIDSLAPARFGLTGPPVYVTRLPPAPFTLRRNVFPNSRAGHEYRYSSWYSR